MPAATATDYDKFLVSSLHFFAFASRDVNLARDRRCSRPTNTKTLLTSGSIELKSSRSSTKPAPGQPYAPRSSDPGAIFVLSILKSNEFREAYHQALTLADKGPRAQGATARKIVESYFRLEQIS